MKRKNRIISLLLSAMLILSGVSGIFAANTAFVEAENLSGIATVTIEDSLPNPEGSDYPEPKGVIIDRYKVDFGEADSMMDCIIRACNENGIPIRLNGDSTYIQGIAGLNEFDKGEQSGWVGTLNGWFTDKGFAYIRANHEEPKYRLKNGDDIHLYYTQTGLGADVGNSEGEKYIKSVSPSDGALSPEFEQEVYEYTLDLGERSEAEISLNPLALYQKNHVKIIKEDVLYEPANEIKVKNGDRLYIRCGAYEDVCDINVDKSRIKEYVIEVKAGEEEVSTDKESVTLDFASNAIANLVNSNLDKITFKIYDRNEDEVERVKLSDLEFSNVSIYDEHPAPPVFSNSQFDRYRWKPELLPGKYKVKGYMENGEGNIFETFESDFSVKKGGENREIFVCCSVMNIDMDIDYPDNQVDTIVKAIGGDGKPVATYTYENFFSYKTFMLRYIKDASCSVSIRARDPGYHFISDQCRINTQEFKYLNISPEYFNIEIKGGKTIQIKIFDRGIFQCTSQIDLMCLKMRMNYTFRYPKDLENFQVCECNTAAYQRFKPIQEVANKYDVQDWEVDESNPGYNELRFSVGVPVNFIITGGGRYMEGGEEKESKYMKALFDETNDANFFEPEFIKRGEKPEYLPGNKDKKDTWHGNNIEHTILTIIKDEGQYQMLQSGKTIDFFTYRTPQATGGSMDNTIMEPDKSFRIFGDSVSISENKGAPGREWNEVKAEKKGASIVAIGYDEGIRCVGLEEENQGDPFEDPDLKIKSLLSARQYYAATDPERIGIVIFDVDGSGDKITPNINKVTKKDGEQPLRKYDRIHFVSSMEYPDGTKKEIKSEASYTFKPTCEDGSKVKVFYHKPIKTMDDFNNKDFFSVPKEGEEPASDWIPAKTGENGSTVMLEHGNNVIMMRAGKHTRYFVIAATGLNIKMNNLSRNGKKIARGDKVQVKLEGIQPPVPKLSAIYNPGFPDTTYLTADVDGKEKTGVRTQYVIQNCNWLIDEMPKNNSGLDYKNLSYTITGSKDFVMKNIKIHGGLFGDALDGHCDIGPEEGRPPNLNADEYKDEYYGQFEDISVPVLHLEYPRDKNSELKAAAGDDSVSFTKKQSEAALVRFMHGEAENLTGIKLDDKLVEKSNYDVDKKSFDIKFKKGYLKTLDIGSHKLKVETTDGNAEGVIIIGDKSINKNGLLSAINKAKKLPEGIAVSADGTDIPRSIKWISKAARAELEKAIKAAQTVLDDSDMSQDEVDRAVSQLNAAMEVFNKSLAYGTKPDESVNPVPVKAENKSTDKKSTDKKVNKSTDKKVNKNELLSAIDKAKKLPEGIAVSADGTDIPKSDKWTNEQARAELEKAIQAAQAILDDSNVSQDEVDRAISQLNAAMEAFNNSLAYGTKLDESEEAIPETAEYKGENKKTKGINSEIPKAIGGVAALSLVSLGAFTVIKKRKI